MTMQMSVNPALITTSHHAALLDGCHANPDYLVFRLGAEQFGVDFQHVVEIRHFAAPVPIANVPGYIKGIVNFRGRLAPIVDMRLKLGLEPACATR